jgi:ABC-type hemin transport system substrate-binding protein
MSSWGIEPVACTRFCERPDLAHVGGTKDPDVAGIAKLRPDLVVVDAEENRREDYEALVSRGLQVCDLHVRSLQDVNAELSKLAANLDYHFEPAVLPIVAPLDQSAIVPIWRRPWMALGSPTYGDSLLRHLGVDNLLASKGAYPVFDIAEAAELGPELVVAPSEPYPFRERHRQELESIGPVRFVDGRDLFWWGVRTPSAITRLSMALRSP